MQGSTGFVHVHIQEWRAWVQDTPLSFETRKMAAPRPAPVLRTRSRSRITAPQLEQFIVVDVQLTGVSLGAGAYGSVEEVEIPGARVAAKKLHTQLINLGSRQQVANYCTSFTSIQEIDSCLI